jgi:bacillithiol system protein YtxJ
MENITEISSLEDFNNLLDLSYKFPVWLFKLSPICPISFYAENQFRTFLNQTPYEIKAFSIDVIKAKSVSRQIALSIEVVHKSPQVLLIHKGKCLWHESHGALTAEEFQRQMGIHKFYPLQ